MHLRRFREADGVHLCWGTPLVTQEQSTGGSHGQENGEGRVTREERVVPGPPAKGMRPFTLEIFVGLSASPVFHMDCLFLSMLVLCRVRKQHWPSGTGWVVDPGHSLDSQQLMARWKEGESAEKVMLLMAFQAQRGLCVQLVIRSGSR